MEAQRRKVVVLAAGAAAIVVAAGGIALWQHARARAKQHAALCTLEVRVKDPAGRPAVRARVRLSSPADKKGAKPRDFATDKNGLARIGKLQPGKLDVFVRLAGAAQAARAIELKRGVQRVEFALGRALNLNGRVVDDSGQPLTGASLAARSDATPSLVQSAQSGADGRFQLEELAAGRYTLEARALYHDFAVLPGIELPSAEAITITLARTSTLRGEVVDDKSQAAPDADVTIAGSGVWPPKTLKSDAKGNFVFEHIPAGIYEVRASRGTWVTPAREGVVLEPAKEGFVRLQLEPGVTLYGRVLDVEDAHALGGVDVTVVEEALAAMPAHVKTDANGEFLVRGLRPLPHRVWLHPRGYVGVNGELRTPAGEPYEFALERAASVSGQVVDELGHPVGEVELEVSGTTLAGLPMIVVAQPAPNAPLGAYPGQTVATPPSGDNLGVTAGVVPMVPLIAGPPGASLLPASGLRADADGNFRIEGIPAGKLQLIARRAGFAPGHSETRAVVAGGLLEGLRIVLPRGATLVGRVLDARDYPVSGVRVQVELEGEPTRVAISGDDGRFELSALHGRCVVTAYPLAGGPARAEVLLASGQQSEIVLRLSGETRDLAGRVRDARGIPVANVRITADAAGTRAPLPRSATSGADGVFRLSGLPAPPYRIRAECPGYAPVVLASVSPAKQEELAIELQPGSRIFGVVVDGLTNNGVPGVLVRARVGAAKDLLQSSTNAQGKFEIPDVNIGKYDIYFDHAGHVPAHVKALLAGPDARELDPVVLKPAGIVSGEVVDRLGAPVREAEVVLDTPAVWTRAVRSDRLGRFRITDAVPGEHVVSARHYQAGASAEPVPVRVYPREESPGIVLRLSTQP